MKLLKKIFFIFLLIISLILIDEKLKLKDIQKIGKIEILDKYSETIYLGNTHENSYVPLNEINKDIINLFILSEDENFYHHLGFNSKRIIKTFYNHLKYHSKEGASTITQQLIKNLYLNQKYSYLRKFKELYLSLRMELSYTKDEILECYLNTIYFGNNIYGIKDASLYYFNKEPLDLTLKEGAILCQIIKNPKLYNPKENNQLLKYANEILTKAYNHSYIKKETLQTELDRIPKFYYHNIDQNPMKLFNNKILNMIHIPTDYNQTIKIKTDYDLNLSKSILKNLSKNIDQEVLIINKKGSIVSYLNTMNEFDSILKFKKKIASTIKPLLYYTYLENGYHEEKLNVKNNKIQYNKKTYQIKNHNLNDEIDLKEAIASSDNIYPILIYLKLNEHKFIHKLKEFNIKASPSIYLPLGDIELSLAQLGELYFPFFNHGISINIHPFNEILVNNKIYYKEKIIKKKMLNKNILNNFLPLLYEPLNTDYKNATASYLNSYYKKIYAKTGSNEQSSYFIAFDNNYLYLIWSGYFDGKKIIDQRYYLESMKLFKKIYEIIN